MSAQLLEGLSVGAQLLMQLAARHEYAPLHYARIPPLAEADAQLAVSEVQQRGLLKPAEERSGMLLLTPLGYALRGAVIAQWEALHAQLRPRLLAHVAELFELKEGAPLLSALHAIDRAWFLPEGSLPLADLDLPVPLGAASMTTSAPHAIVAMLRALGLRRGERVLVCGAKAGVTMALSAHIVGPDGRVVGLDPDLAVVRHAAACLQRAGDLQQIAPIEVRRVEDVTVGLSGAAPWDVVIVNGSVPKVPLDLVAQLSARGRLLLFLQEAATEGQTCYVLHRGGEISKEELLSRFVFTPIYGRWGWDRIEELGLSTEE